MRLSRPDVSADERKWLLDIEDGKTSELDQQDPENTSWIDIPLTYCLPDNEQGLSKLIDFIYDQNTLRTPSVVTLQQKAIVCPKNETADTINSKSVTPDYQLAASPTTYYYLNSNIPEAQESRVMFKSRYQETPPLIICKFSYQDTEKEKLRNKYPLKTLMEQNPVSYKAIRFTAEATITSINTNRDWYYVSCHQCNKAAINQGEKYSCLDHGPQPGPFFRYKFKGHIRDSSGTALMTFFSSAADKITKHHAKSWWKIPTRGPKKDTTQKVVATQLGKQASSEFISFLCKTTDLTL
ncbi:DNA helicase [Tanacetum coccineum]